MKKSRDPYSLRVATVMMIILVFTGIVMVRLFAIQLFNSEGLKGYAESQGMRSEDIFPERGLILDRNDNILANNIIEYNIGARYIDLLEPENCFKALAQAFDKTPEYYRSQFKKESSFYMLETKVRPEIVKILRSENSCHGLSYDKKMSRIYPYQDAAGQLLGFLSSDGVAQTGIERYYDDILKGEKGRQMIQRDKRGNIITLQNSNSKPAIPGGKVKTTIDIEYQVILEEEIAAAVKRSNAKGGMGVLMDPNTGEVLAMANYPPFDPNEVRNSSADIRKNRVIADQFEPGSIYKFIPASAALENNILSPSSKIFCENGEWKVHDRIIHDTKEHGWLTLEEVIIYSSNIGAGKIAEQVGNKTIYDISRKFGFGEPTAIGLWNESGGLLKAPKDWSSVGHTQLAMGHGVAVTLMQIMSAYSAIANGGTLLKPFVVSQTYNEKNKLKDEFTRTPIRQVISEETATTIQYIMEDVVNIGTATRAKIDGYHLAGKTGTAQKVVDGKYSNNDYYASFIGFLPAGNPVLVCGIVLDEPSFGMHHGGTSAAPAVKNTFVRIINTPTFEQLYPALKKVAEKKQPVTQIESKQSNPLLSILHGNKSEKDTPEPTVEIEEQFNDTFIEPDEYDIIMPDVSGLHILNARRKLETIGLNVTVNETRGKVKRQFPPAGSHLKKGTLCRLEANQ